MKAETWKHFYILTQHANYSPDKDALFLQSLERPLFLFLFVHGKDLLSSSQIPGRFTPTEEPKSISLGDPHSRTAVLMPLSECFPYRQTDSIMGKEAKQIC